MNKVYISINVINRSALFDIFTSAQNWFISSVWCKKFDYPSRGMKKGQITWDWSSTHNYNAIICHSQVIKSLTLPHNFRYVFFLCKKYASTRISIVTIHRGLRNGICGSKAIKILQYCGCGLKKLKISPFNQNILRGI